MTTTDWLIAWLVIVSPDSIKDTSVIYAAMPLLRAPIVAIAIDLEIIDQRECRNKFVSAADFKSDLEQLQKSYRVFCDMPMSQKANVLPSNGEIRNATFLNRAYRQYLSDRLKCDSLNVERIVELINETDALYAVWDAASDARCEYYYVWVRREALQKIRELIGPECFSRGIMPFYLPVHQFETVRR